MSTKTLLLLSAFAFTTSCGKSAPPSTPKIVAGRTVSPRDAVAKSTVALVRANGNQFCSGTLVDARHVVTAAHCRADYSGSLAVAFAVIARPGEVEADHLIAASIRANGGYNAGAIRGGLSNRAPNDIAIVTLASDAPDDYAPVAVLGADDTLRPGETLTVAGYGLTSAGDRGSNGVLRRASTRLVDAADSAKEFVLDGGGRACGGDSGGPAFVSRGGQLALAGVTSRGEHQCQGQTIYTDVRYFQSWISQATGG